MGCVITQLIAIELIVSNFPIKINHSYWPFQLHLAMEHKQGLYAPFAISIMSESI